VGERESKWIWEVGREMLKGNNRGSGEKEFVGKRIILDRTREGAVKKGDPCIHGGGQGKCLILRVSEISRVKSGTRALEIKTLDQRIKRNIDRWREWA